MSDVTIVQLADLHFGWPVDLAQIRVLGELIPTLVPSAIVVAGDLTQRARHGEFQRSVVFTDLLAGIAPTLVIPGNHDVQWWQSPFGVRGQTPKYRKYRRYYGMDLKPSLRVPGATIAGALTSYGFSFGALTWNPNDVTVKGHLPRSETERLGRLFRSADDADLRVAVVHHNVLRGEVSERMGLAHWKSAQRRLRAAGSDIVLCGHDHQEGVGQIDGVVPVSTVGTPTSRSRGGRPTVFNVIRADDQAISIQHYRWEADRLQYRASDQHAFAWPRQRRPASTTADAAGGD